MSTKIELQSSQATLECAPSRIASAKSWLETVLDSPRVWWAGLSSMLGTLIAPLLMAGVPPLTDYPNHLARCYLLAFGQSDPVLSQMFYPRWQIIPNIAVDLLLPALMHAFPPLVAGRIVLALCLLLPTSGTVALSYAYFRRRSFWQIAAGFAAFNLLFLMGFMNFELSIGIALWGAAAWVHYRERFAVATAVSGAVVATLAFFFHMFGFCFYALLIGSYELSILLGQPLRTLPTARFVAKRIGLLLLTLAVPAILYFVSPLQQIQTSAAWPSMKQKAASTWAPFVGYSTLVDVLTIIPVLALLIFCVMRGHSRIARPALICSAILLATYVVMPRMLKGTYFMDIRLPVMLGFMIFAGFIPERLTARHRAAAIMAFAVLFIVRISFISSVWMHSQRDVDNVRQVIATIAPGSRVLAADVVCSDNQAWCASMPAGRRLPDLTTTYGHLASFVLLDRHAFWPNIFAEPGKQPVVIKPPYSELLAVDSPPPNYLDLAATRLTPLEASRFPYLAGWNKKFDYVLVLNAEGAPDLDHFLPTQLQLIDRQGIAALFRIHK